MNQKDPNGGGASSATPRSIEFNDEIAGMQIRTPVDADERRWLLAGLGLIGVGVVLIIGGWFGASGTAYEAAQMPYLISGGVFGLAVVVVGAALFVRYSLSRYLRFWLVRSLYEQRVQTDRQVEVLERVEQLLLAAVRTRDAASGPPPSSVSGPQTPAKY